MTARLLTIGVSHYCEKARWALERAGIDFVEEAHAPLFHLVAGRGSRPRFIDGAVDLGDSTAILRHVDGFLDESRKLYPASLGQAPLAAEEGYDATLGVDVRRVVYGMFAQEAHLFGRIGAALAPPLEARFVSAFPRVVLAPIVRAYKAAGPLPGPIARIEVAFAEASAVLETQPFLAGDRFSAADLTFAALAAPLVFPEGHPAMPTFADAAGTKIRAFATPFRESRAGAHVLRMYREMREPSPAHRESVHPRG